MRRTSFHDANVAQGSVSSWKDDRAAWEGCPLGQSGQESLMASWPREMALGGVACQRLMVSKLKSSRPPHPAPPSSCFLPGGHLPAWTGTAPGQSSTGRSCCIPNLLFFFFFPFFIVVKYMYTRFTILTILSVHFSAVKHIHTVGQLTSRALPFAN